MTPRYRTSPVHLVVLAVMSLTSSAWGQFSGPGSGGEIYYNGGNVGIGTNSWSPYGARLAVWANNNNDQVMTIRNTNAVGLSSIRLEDNNGNYVGDIGYYNLTGVNGIRIGGNGGVNTYFPTGNVGIGTTNPTTALQIGNAASYAQDARITMATANGLGNTRTWSIGAKYGGAVSSSPNYGFTIRDETVGTERLVIDWVTGNVGIGTTVPQYTLAVNGTIGAKEIIVTNSGWADYVFKSGYRLQPLSEVSAYIQQNHHLPEIPSEAEVLESGVSIGEMQVKLLAKIEELTLHMIRADEENQELKKRITQLEAK